MNILSSRYRGLAEALAGREQCDVPLVAFRDGSFYPAGMTDDMGAFYFIPELSHRLGLPLDEGINVFYAGLLLGSLLLGAVSCWFLFKHFLSRLLMLGGLLHVVALAAQAGNNYLVSPAVVLATVPLALCCARRQAGGAALGAAVLFTGVFAGTAGVVRAHAGTSALLLVLGLLWLDGRHLWRRKAVMTGLLVVGAALPQLYFARLVHDRDQFLRAADPEYHPPLNRHPFWHTVYCGFGFLHNGYGLEWNDTVAAERVKRDRPEAAYVSAEYESALRDAVVELYARDPGFVAQTIAAKLGILCFFVLRYATVGLVCAVFDRGRRRIQLALAAALAFEGLAGVVAIPHPAYLAGFVALSILAGVFFVAGLIDDEPERDAPLSLIWAAVSLGSFRIAWKGDGIEGLLPVAGIALATAVWVYRTRRGWDERRLLAAWSPRMRRVLYAAVCIAAVVSVYKLGKRADRKIRGSCEHASAAPQPETLSPLCGRFPENRPWRQVPG